MINLRLDFSTKALGLHSEIRSSGMWRSWNVESLVLYVLQIGLVCCFCGCGYCGQTSWAGTVRKKIVVARLVLRASKRVPEAPDRMKQAQCPICGALWRLRGAGAAICNCCCITGHHFWSTRQRAQQSRDCY